MHRMNIEIKIIYTFFRKRKDQDQKRYPQIDFEAFFRNFKKD